MDIDLDDTSRCPKAARCESCGNRPDLAVATFDTPVGVYCATVCDPCVDAGRFPSWGWAGTARRAMDHCGHLGIDVEQMSAARREQGWSR